MPSNAIGMIETKGYVAALAAADAMVKAANVTITTVNRWATDWSPSSSPARSAPSRRPPRRAPNPRRR